MASTGCLNYLLYGFAGFLILGAILPDSSKNEVSKNQSSENMATVASTNNVKPVWTYELSKDEMRSSTTKWAWTESTNIVDLGFPYGEQRGMIQVRQSPKFGLDIIIGARDGQILCSSYQRTYISVKFDNGPIQRYRCSNASDGSSNMVFIEGSRNFLKKLKKSKTVIVEAEFFQNGLHQMKFKTEGLNWE